jgi:hypothetical protein
MTVSINGTSGLIFNDASVQNTSAITGGFAFRNRIINGAMVIDQRNAGASVTIAAGGSGYATDRFLIANVTDGAVSAQQDSSAPTGFIKSTKITVTTADTSLGTDQRLFLAQYIEGTNIADLGWGTANASTVTLSFWVRSSLTGTFGGALANNALDRAYPFSYTISVADTWEQKYITIAGDTTGTWLTTTDRGIRVFFALGAASNRSGTANAWVASSAMSVTGAVSVIGTNGATFYITGVQLEKGSTATSFDYRPYGTELALCQRYYQRVKAVSSATRFASGFSQNATQGEILIPFPVTMRTAPTGLDQSGTASDYRVTTGGGSGVVCSAVPVFNTASTDLMDMVFTVASGLTAGQGTVLLANTGANAFLGWNAEL